VSIEKGWPDIRHFSVHKFSDPSLTRAGFPFPLYLLEVLKHVIDSKKRKRSLLRNGRCGEVKKEVCQSKGVAICGKTGYLCNGWFTYRLVNSLLLKEIGLFDREERLIQTSKPPLK
jgi:hypothetical protein